MGHTNLPAFRKFIKTPEDNTKIIVDDWNKSINKRDIVFLLGDICFDKASLDILGNLKGRKILVSGNHCNLVSFQDKCAVFEEIHGMLQYKKFWLTHCPIHPDEMRGRKANIHSHVHTNIITKKNWYGRKVLDPRYFHVGMDSTWPQYGSIFATLDQVRAIYP